MQMLLNSYSKLSQEGENARYDMELVVDIRPEASEPWKRGEPESGPSYATCVVMPGKAELLGQEFLNRLGREYRELVESRMKRALLY